MLQWHVDSWGVGTFERVNDGLLEQAAVDDDDDDGDEDTFWKISVRSSNTAGQDMLKMWRRVCRCNTQAPPGPSQLQQKSEALHRDWLLQPKP